jgi:hypothetical protein
MKSKGALASAVVIVFAILPAVARAQPASTAWDAPRLMPWAPSQIMAQVQRAGFEPVSRPIQRGNIYLLFAVDPADTEVKLAVDARSGRVLWAAPVARSGYGPYGYRLFSRSERPPIPPAEIPNVGPGKSTASMARRSPPLPRLRPVDLTSTATKESAVGTQSETKTAAPPRQPETLPSAVTLRPGQPAMVPVAPLE